MSSYFMDLLCIVLRKVDTNEFTTGMIRLLPPLDFVYKSKSLDWYWTIMHLNKLLDNKLQINDLNQVDPSPKASLR